MSVFFFTDTATTEIYTLSLHDALPIYTGKVALPIASIKSTSAVFALDTSLTTLTLPADGSTTFTVAFTPARSEEHTSELQSHVNLVCRLLLEKKKQLTGPPQSARLSQP